MAKNEPLVDALLQQVQTRLDTPLTDDEEIGRLRKSIDGVIERAETLRSFELTNADEPYFVFSACRAEEE
jgi:hypothetical protein